MVMSVSQELMFGSPSHEFSEATTVIVEPAPSRGDALVQRRRKPVPSGSPGSRMN
jgi:hypothetical protein